MPRFFRNKTKGTTRRFISKWLSSMLGIDGRKVSRLFSRHHYDPQKVREYLEEYGLDSALLQKPAKRGPKKRRVESSA